MDGGQAYDPFTRQLITKQSGGHSSEADPNVPPPATGFWQSWRNELIEDAEFVGGAITGAAKFALGVAAFAALSSIPGVGVALAVAGSAYLGWQIGEAQGAREAAGQSAGQSWGGALGDATGASGVWAGVTGDDIATGQDLGLDAYGRGEAFGGGVGQMALIGAGAMESVRGVRGSMAEGAYVRSAPEATAGPRRVSLDVLQPTERIGAGQTSCFLSGTDVLRGDGDKIDIEDVHVGQRVATDGGESNTGHVAADPSATSINRKTWRLLTIHAERTMADGTPDTWEIQTLQPRSWIRARHADAGGWLDLSSILDLMEMGLPDGLRGHLRRRDARDRVRAGPRRADDGQPPEQLRVRPVAEGRVGRAGHAGRDRVPLVLQRVAG